MITSSVVFLALVTISALFAIYLLARIFTQSSHESRSLSNIDHYSQLMNVISIQNETITSLENLVHNYQKILTAKSFDHSISTILVPIVENKQSIVKCDPVIRHESSPITQHHSIGSVLIPAPTDHTKSCERKYGLELIENWRNNRESWCESRDDTAESSKLECFPYHQDHKKLDGRGSDLFCTATNFVIDFSKVSMK